MNKLKPCPFCGGEGCIQEHKFYGYQSTFGVVCLDCCCETRQFFMKLEEAVEKWNTRAEDTARGAYDRTDTYTNCTVQILTNTATGETSLGWWRNDKPPMIIGDPE